MQYTINDQIKFEKRFYNININQIQESLTHITSTNMQNNKACSLLLSDIYRASVAAIQLNPSLTRLVDNPEIIANVTSNVLGYAMIHALAKNAPQIDYERVFHDLAASVQVNIENVTQGDTLTNKAINIAQGLLYFLTIPLNEHYDNKKAGSQFNSIGFYKSCYIGEQMESGKTHKHIMLTSHAFDRYKFDTSALRALSVSHPPMLIQPKAIQGNQGGYYFFNKNLVSMHGKALPKGAQVPTQDTNEIQCINYMQSIEFAINVHMLAVYNQGIINPYIPVTDDMDKEKIKSINAKNENTRQAITQATMLNDEFDSQHFYNPMFSDTRFRKYYHCALSVQSSDAARSLIHFARGDVVTRDNQAQAEYALAMIFTAHAGLDKTTINGITTKRPIDNDSKKLNKMGRLQLYANYRPSLINAGKHLIDATERPTNVPSPVNVDILDEFKGEHYLQLLALCIDLYWMDFSLRNNGAAIVQTIAGFDGTVSGVQHQSVLMRNADMAKSVGIYHFKKGEFPPDLYSNVANTMIDVFNEEMKKGDDVIKLLKQIKINRKLCKKPCMVKSYSAGLNAYKNYLSKEIFPLYSFDFNKIKKQVKQSIKPELLKGKTKEQQQSFILWVAKQQAAERYARLLEKAIKQNIKPVLMNLIKAAVNLWCLKHTSGFIQYTNKVSGAISTWTKYKQQQHTVKFYVQRGKGKAKAITKTINITTNEIDASAMITSSAPNFTHNLDACLVTVTALKARDAGILAFASAHDEIATSILNYKPVNMMARQAMVEMYAHDHVSDFLTQLDILATFDELNAQYATQGEIDTKSDEYKAYDKFKKAYAAYNREMDNPTLDLNVILESDYFMA